MESCTDKHGFACSNRTAADQPIKLASSKANSRTQSAKFTIAAASEKQPAHRGRDRGAAHLATKKAKPTVTTAKAEPPASGAPLPPPSLKTELEFKSSVPAAGPGTTGLSVADPRSTVGPAPNSNSRTIQEQVAAATAVAERMTVTAATAARDGADPIAGASPDTEPLVAVVIVRPEIPSVFALTAKNVAIDDRYSASSGDIMIAIVAAGGPAVQLSAGHTAAIDRLVNGEVPAAVAALVSVDAAEAFPEIKGFKIFHLPLSSRWLKPRP